jgi:hypothetical protein
MLKRMLCAAGLAGALLLAAPTVALAHDGHRHHGRHGCGSHSHRDGHRHHHGRRHHHRDNWNRGWNHSNDGWNCGWNHGNDGWNDGWYGSTGWYAGSIGW